MNLPYSFITRLHIVFFYTKLLFLLLLFSFSWRILGKFLSDSNVDQNILETELKPVHPRQGRHLQQKAESRDSPRGGPLILLWNRYQETGSRVYNRIFARYQLYENQ